MLPLVLLSLSLLVSQNWNAKPAIVFLDSLNPEQLKMAQLPFEDVSRHTWHFLPGEMWSRAGIPLYKLDPSQKRLLFRLLEENLSRTGYEKTKKIIDLENVLAEITGDRVFRDPEKYYAAFYGDPRKDSLWAWSFEGHHISLNFSTLDNKISIAPRFLGANPAIIGEGKRKGERTLAHEDDIGLQLINEMTPAQRQKAIFQEGSFPDIVTANATDVSPLEPAGIRYDELDQNQQRLLLTLINEYISIMPTELATKRMNNLKKEEFGKIRFGWAGQTELGKPHYYRIQGKTFLVEFDNTQNNANHIHTVWRDFDGDFGKDLIKEHYQRSSHHH